MKTLLHRVVAVIIITSEKQLREWTATYSVDERGSVLDGLFSFVSGLFSKKEEVKGTSAGGDNVAKVNFLERLRPDSWFFVGSSVVAEVNDIIVHEMP